MREPLCAPRIQTDHLVLMEALAIGVPEVHRSPCRYAHTPGFKYSKLTSEIFQADTLFPLPIDPFRAAPMTTRFGRQTT